MIMTKRKSKCIVFLIDFSDIYEPCKCLVHRIKCDNHSFVRIFLSIGLFLQYELGC